MRKFCMLLCFIFLTVMTACSKGPAFDKTTLTIETAAGKKHTLSVELAKTPEQQARGFMERKSIPEGTGMFFVFERDQIASFWMKNTPTALSIAYIDSRGNIRDILDMVPHNLTPVNSSVSVRYALEVPQGWFAKKNIQVGDVVVLQLK